MLGFQPKIIVIEDDVKIIPRMDARINERIKAQFDNPENSDDLSGYMV